MYINIIIMSNIPDILTKQKHLFKKLNPNINCDFSEDGSHIFASNISENDFKNITLVTNDLGYSGKPMNFVDIKVYLTPQGKPQNVSPTNIIGLEDIVRHSVEYSDSEAFFANKNTHQPFINGFGVNKTDISPTIDNLSQYSYSLPVTTSITFIPTYTIRLSFFSW